MNNFELINLLNKLLEYNKLQKEKYKVKAYKRAIENIELLPFELTLNNVPVLLENKLVGEKIYKKIEEYLKSGTIEELKTINKVNKLLKIKGFTEKLVTKLNDNYIYSVEDLYNNKEIYDDLTDIQKLMLKYHKDLEERIKRRETDIIVKKLDIEKYNYIVTGSYRRELLTSGDIDILFKSKTPEKLIKELLEKIKANPDVVGIIASGKSKISFLYRNEYQSDYKQVKKVRQVDIRAVKPESFSCALMYFTGSADFNQIVRGVAKKKGFKLNEYYLESLLDGTKLYPKTEREIFKILGIKFLYPKSRLPKFIELL